MPSEAQLRQMRELRDQVEQWLAWKRVASEISAGTLGSELDSAELADIRTKVRAAGDAAREKVWGDYRFVVIADASAPDGLASIDLGAGHSSSSESLCGRVISALKSSALLNESVGAGYLERNWPPALKKDAAWPLLSLRQSFLDGSLTRLVDPDGVLCRKIVEFVGRGDFGLGSGRGADGRFERVSFREAVAPEDVMFETRAGGPDISDDLADGSTSPGPGPDVPVDPQPPVPPAPSARKAVHVRGDIPPEIWNRLGTRLLPKLRSGRDLKVGVAFELTTDGASADPLLADLREILEDLQLADRIRIDVE